MLMQANAADKYVMEVRLMLHAVFLEEAAQLLQLGYFIFSHKHNVHHQGLRRLGARP